MSQRPIAILPLKPPAAESFSRGIVASQSSSLEESSDVKSPGAPKKPSRKKPPPLPPKPRHMIKVNLGSRWKFASNPTTTQFVQADATNQEPAYGNVDRTNSEPDCDKTITVKLKQQESSADVTERSQHSETNQKLFPPLKETTSRMATITSLRNTNTNNNKPEPAPRRKTICVVQEEAPSADKAMLEISTELQKVR